jgi:hypothetical protein
MLRSNGLLVKAHEQEILGLSPGNINWMDISYYNKKTEIKVANWDTPKKCNEKTYQLIKTKTKVKTGQGRSRQVKTGQDRSRQVKTGQDRPRYIV